MLLATAVRPFEGLDAHDRAFYEAFRRFDLPPDHARRGRLRVARHHRPAPPRSGAARPSAW
jgi:hypothetical protein